VAVDADRFKHALRRWPSGVTVVTACAGDTIHGMTVSAFSSVSLDPPLVLVCADKASNTHPVIAEGRVFAVHILAQGQDALSHRFASKADEWRRFEGLAWTRGVTGAPILPGALAVIDCRVVADHEAGDHVIYVGEVEAVELAEAEPLLWYGGRYRTLAG
jgi:flavin reductase (DIM6/NTAB) family NADH-FMN oxidoreductase RutF